MVNLKNQKYSLLLQIKGSSFYLRNYYWSLGNKCVNMPKFFKNNERLLAEEGEPSEINLFRSIDLFHYGDSITSFSVLSVSQNIIK